MHIPAFVSINFKFMICTNSHSDCKFIDLLPWNKMGNLHKLQY